MLGIVTSLGKGDHRTEGLTLPETQQGLVPQRFGVGNVGDEKDSCNRGVFLLEVGDQPMEGVPDEIQVPNHDPHPPPALFVHDRGRYHLQDHLLAAEPCQPPFGDVRRASGDEMFGHPDAQVPENPVYLVFEKHVASLGMGVLKNL